MFWWRIGLGGEDGGDGGAVVVWHGCWTTIVFDARMWCANCISYWKIWAVTCCCCWFISWGNGGGDAIIRHYFNCLQGKKRITKKAPLPCRFDCGFGTYSLQCMLQGPLIQAMYLVPTVDEKRRERQTRRRQKREKTFELWFTCNSYIM